MKRHLSCSILAATLLLSGCGIDKDAAPNYVSGQIHLLYDREAVAEREEASVYSGTYYQAELAPLQEHLLHSQASEPEQNAFGRAFYVEDPDTGMLEHLILYDTGSEAGVYGGFTYGISPQQDDAAGSSKNYQDVANLWPGHPGETAQLSGYTKTEDFSRQADLDFMTMDKAAQTFQALAADCGLPAVQRDEIYALDMDTLQKHSDLYADTMQKLNALDADATQEQDDPAAASVTWEKEDEAYLLQFVQVVDGIPLMDHMWCTDRASRNAGTLETAVFGALSGDGLISLNVSGVVSLKEELERRPLLAAQEAEALFLAKYDDGTRLSDLYAESLSLEYVIQLDGDGLLLVPAWVFCLSQDRQAEDLVSGESTSIKDYDHYVINAVTGNEIKSGILTDVSGDSPETEALP